MTEPLNPAGYLRALHLTFDGVATTSGAVADAFTDPRYRRTWLRRCHARPCQRKRWHDGEHYYRRRRPPRFSRWGGDEPFTVIEPAANG